MANDSFTTRTVTVSSLISNIVSMSTTERAPLRRLCRPEKLPTSHRPFKPGVRFNRYRENKYKHCVVNNGRNTDRRDRENERFSRKGRCGGSSRDTKAPVTEQGGKNANPAAQNDPKKLDAEAASNAFADSTPHKRPSMTSLVLAVLMEIRVPMQRVTWGSSATYRSIISLMIGPKINSVTLSNLIIMSTHWDYDGIDPGGRGWDGGDIFDFKLPKSDIIATNGTEWGNFRLFCRYLVLI